MQNLFQGFNVLKASNTSVVCFLTLTKPARLLYAFCVPNQYAA